jgi:peroxiredoxin Q/BCP
VFGVSKDSIKSHQKFRAKECLPFPLITDDGSICEAYGAWRKKKLYGREYDGIARITVVIAPTGTVAKVFDPVRANGHAAEVLAFLPGDSQ